MGIKKSVDRAFGYGESEYVVSFGLAPLNGELSPSDPKYRNLLTLRSGPGTRNVQIRTPYKIWGRQDKTWGPGAYTLRDKRSMVKLACFWLVKCQLETCLTSTFSFMLHTHDVENEFQTVFLVKAMYTRLGAGFDPKIPICCLNSSISREPIFDLLPIL